MADPDILFQSREKMAAKFGKELSSQDVLLCRLQH
jgi:hypothetical protein